MIASRTLHCVLSLFAATFLTACFSTDSSSESSSSYTVDIPFEANVVILVDESGMDSTGVGFSSLLLELRDHHTDKRPGVHIIAGTEHPDSLVQMYFVQGAEDAWAVVSPTLDSLIDLRDSLSALESLDSAMAIDSEYWQIRDDFYEEFAKQKKYLTSSCSFLVRETVATNPLDPGSTIPVVSSLHTANGFTLIIDQVASNLSGSTSLNIVGWELTGTIRVTCPDPLK